MPARHSLKKVRDFEIHTLANEFVSISMAPELGGRIVSMRDRISRREWLDGWSPAGKRRIWHPTDPADFATGPGAGIDECLPTVLACELGEAVLADHGELWNQQPAFARDLAGEGILACQWHLKSLPLAFERRISIGENQIRLDYRLENRADAVTPFLWAWHPLFNWQPGDQIRCSETTCLTTDGARLPWPEAYPGTDLSLARFQKGTTPAAKLFLGPLNVGELSIVAKNGATLTLGWPSSWFPYAGIWITRGFWKGLHHWAIEPTNAPVDRLSDIKELSHTSLLAPGEVREWSLVVGLGGTTENENERRT
ncbi:MAG: hypothetical protein WEB53_08930 [Akkermansiaceae bacterium]